MTETPRRRSSRLVFGIVVAVLVAALGVEAFEAFLLLKAKPKAERPPEALRAIAAGANKTATLGDPKAPIKIDFYAPLTLPWHQKTIGLLRAYDKQHPGRIFVRLMWIGNSEADAEMLKRGFTCAVIFINGEHEFTLPNGKQVDLQKKPNNGDASFYNSEDVITVLDQMAGEAAK
jgi:hypothetical protein